MLCLKFLAEEMLEMIYFFIENVLNKRINSHNCRVQTALNYDVFFLQNKKKIKFSTAKAWFLSFTLL